MSERDGHLTTEEQPAAAAPAAPGAPGGEPVEVSPGVYKRLTSGFGGYVMALAACFTLVGVIVLLTPRDQKELLPTVDYQGHALVLRQAAPYTSYAPQGLPAGWHPTSSRLTGANGGGPVAWHLGFVTPAGEYAALEESNERAGDFVSRMTNMKQPEGAQQVAGAEWQRYFRVDKKQRSLVRRAPGVTLVVTGTASYDELAVLAGSLQPRPRPTPGVASAAPQSPAPGSPRPAS